MERPESPKKKCCDVLKYYWIAYLKALRSNPLLTKAITSSVLGMAGNLTAQLINKHNGVTDEICGKAVRRYGAFGLVVSGPVVHFFYKFLDRLIPPSKSKEDSIKRFFAERLLLAPLFSLVFHAFMSALQYKTIAPVAMSVRAYFWPTLLMNWKYWTVLQFVNVNYVPTELKPLFGSLCGFLWNILLSTGILQAA